LLRIYDWVPNANPSAAGQPFVEPETMGAQGPFPHHLIAGDGHRLPFPLRIIDSRHYRRADRCRVRLFAQSDLSSGRRPGIDYFMEIHLSGESHLFDQAAEAGQALGVIPPTTGPGLFRGLLGALGLSACVEAAALTAGATVLLAPDPYAAPESTWQRRVQLSTGSVTIQYELLA
jgi:hypothetical protein